MLIAVMGVAGACPFEATMAKRLSGGRSAMLRECRVAQVSGPVLCATVNVPENRTVANGRKLPIRVVVLPAQGKTLAGGPIFAMAGGPGQTSTGYVHEYAKDPRRGSHDFVFVDHRGTGEGHLLDCPRPARNDPRDFLKPVFSAEAAADCRRALERKFDLSRYTTLEAARDLDAVREALGYQRINFDTSSFGSYLASIYIREYPGRVRAAFLGSLVSQENRVPLHLAQDSQFALDTVLRECEADADCQRAYPRVRDDLYEILLELRQSPVSSYLVDEHDGARLPVQLTAAAFSDALRVMLYSSAATRRLPFLIAQAKAGDYSPFVAAAASSTRRLYNSIRFGLFLSVTCNEFVARIDPGEVRAATEGTFLGDSRVRSQMAACSQWPSTILPSDFFRPFSSTVPVLLSSYSADPATAARWMEFAKRTFPNSLVVTTPGGHWANNSCTDRLARELFETASVKTLDTACVTSVSPPKFLLPEASQGQKP